MLTHPRSMRSGFLGKPKLRSKSIDIPLYFCYIALTPLFASPGLPISWLSCQGWTTFCLKRIGHFSTLTGQSRRVECPKGWSGARRPGRRAAVGQEIYGWDGLTLPVHPLLPWGR